MKYSWPAFINEYWEVFRANIRVLGEDPTIISVVEKELDYLIKNTDRFHPFESDRGASSALEKIPSYCDYRSCGRMWAYREQRMKFEDALYDMFEESFGYIEDFYSNIWNFAPGTVIEHSFELKKSWDEVLRKKTARILRLSKLP